jgi:hypothetical protein
MSENHTEARLFKQFIRKTVPSSLKKIHPGEMRVRVVSLQKPLPDRPYVDDAAIMCDGFFFVEGDDSETRARAQSMTAKRSTLWTEDSLMKILEKY